MLVENGANLDAQNPRGETALLIAIQNNDMVRSDCLIHRSAANCDVENT